MVEKKDGIKAKVVINFFVYYEIDSNLSSHVLTLGMYGGDDSGCWVLLEAEGSRLVRGGVMVAEVVAGQVEAEADVHTGLEEGEVEACDAM